LPACLPTNLPPYLQEGLLVVDRYHSPNPDAKTRLGARKDSGSSFGAHYFKVG
jgi:hypothetical protein